MDFQQSCALRGPATHTVLTAAKHPGPGSLTERTVLEATRRPLPEPSPIPASAADANLIYTAPQVPLTQYVC